MFVPQATSLLQHAIGFFTGRRTEFIDPRIVTTPHGREGKSQSEKSGGYLRRRFAVTRVKTQGFITVTFNVVLKDLKKHGFDMTPNTMNRHYDAPLPDYEAMLQPRNGQNAPPLAELPSLQETSEEQAAAAEDTIQVKGIFEHGRKAICTFRCCRPRLQP